MAYFEKLVEDQGRTSVELPVNFDTEADRVPVHVGLLDTFADQTVFVDVDRLALQRAGVPIAPRSKFFANLWLDKESGQAKLSNFVTGHLAVQSVMEV